tara:strand:- start:5 stop:394 length:390 start_codon:yes stop_codon:yes gene_type:complete
MPSKLYDCRTETYFDSKEDQLKERKRRDNVSQKIRYWRKTYKYDLKKSDYEEFNKHVNIIKKVHKLHDFIVMYNEKRKSISKDIMDTYGKNYNKINQGLEIQAYLKTLTKLEPTPEEPVEKDKFVIDNW